MKKMLFVCIHNSARSQMAEAFINTLGKGKFSAESAGLEPGKLNPIVVKAMLDEGIDISQNKTNGVFDFLKEGRTYDYVVTVCDGASGERCPVFPGKELKRLHWEFRDPSGLKGTDEEKLAGTKIIRDEIKARILQFLENGLE